jgi:hypothetical protein
MKRNQRKSKHLIIYIILCIKISLCDAAELWQLNIQDPASYLLQGMLDFHNYIRLVSKTKLLGSINVSDSISLTGFTERNDTMVSGHYFELELSSHMSNYSCSLPIAAGNLLDDNYIYVGGNYAPPMTGDFTVLIKDQDGNVIQTFTTSGEYMVNILTGIQQVIGNTTPVIIQNII